MKKKTTVVPFLYYVKNGVCKPSKQMPRNGYLYDGWKSSAWILRNVTSPRNEELKLSKQALKEFLAGLKPHEEIREKDLVT